MPESNSIKKPYGRPALLGNQPTRNKPMLPENLSRRAILAGAAAVPALALPAVAYSSAESDPILAAIEAHRQGHAEYVMLCNSDETDSDPAVDDALTCLKAPQ
jgi:hypothetical protein